METEYDFKTILDIIETAEKYKYSRKRPRSEKVFLPFNYDMEKLSDCLIPLRKLNDLVGMDDLKKNIIDQILFFVQDLNTNEMMHTCLTGPPGVGKTTLGKILAELYCSLGFLKSNNFTVVSRPDLIAGYIGQTALKTQKVLNNNLGGVLFIDEAYSLGKGGDEDYSHECIDTINKFLSENTTDFIMIIAGYRDDLDKYFFGLNKGLRRRFPWTYDISKYTTKNLKEIFQYQVNQNRWKLECMDLEKIFIENKDIFDNNGGDTLILFDKAKICHSRRVFGKKKKFKKILNEEDISRAISLVKKEKDKVNKKDTPPYGMYV